MAKANITNGTNGIESTGAIHLTLQGKGGVGKSLVASMMGGMIKSVDLPGGELRRTFLGHTTAARRVGAAARKSPPCGTSS